MRLVLVSFVCLRLGRCPLDLKEENSFSKFSGYFALALSRSALVLRRATFLPLSSQKLLCRFVLLLL